MYAIYESTHIHVPFIEVKIKRQIRQIFFTEIFLKEISTVGSRVFLICPDFSATNLSRGKFVLKSEKKRHNFTKSVLSRDKFAQDKSGTL